MGDVKIEILGIPGAIVSQNAKAAKAAAVHIDWAAAIAAMVERSGRESGSVDPLDGLEQGLKGGTFGPEFGGDNKRGFIKNAPRGKVNVPQVKINACPCLKDLNCCKYNVRVKNSIAFFATFSAATGIDTVTPAYSVSVVFDCRVKKRCCDLSIKQKDRSVIAALTYEDAAGDKVGTVKTSTGKAVQETHKDTAGTGTDLQGNPTSNLTYGTSNQAGGKLGVKVGVSPTTRGSTKNEITIKSPSFELPIFELGSNITDVIPKPTRITGIITDIQTVTLWLECCRKSNGSFTKCPLGTYNIMSTMDVDIDLSTGIGVVDVRVPEVSVALTELR